MKSKKNIFFILFILLFLIAFKVKQSDFIEKILNNEIKKENLPEFEYKYYDIGKDGKYTTLLTFRDLNGIDQISYIGNGNQEFVIYGNGKTEIGIDFAANNYTHYYFSTVSLTGEKNIDDLYLEIVDENYTGPIYQISNSNIIANSNKVAYGTSSPQKMFDGNTSSDYQNYGCYIYQITFPLHINFILDKPRKIFKMRYFTYAGGNYQPIDFTIQGSNDTTNGSDGTWTTIKTYTGLNIIPASTWGEFFVGSNTAYKAYKMNITKIKNNDNQFLYNEMELYDY